MLLHTELLQYVPAVVWDRDLGPYGFEVYMIT